MHIDALSVLCVQLSHDLLAIAKFLLLFFVTIQECHHCNKKLAFLLFHFRIIP